MQNVCSESYGYIENKKATAHRWEKDTCSATEEKEQDRHVFNTDVRKKEKHPSIQM